MSLKSFRVIGILSLAILGVFLATKPAAAQQQGWPYNPQPRWWEAGANRVYRSSSALAVANSPSVVASAQVSTQIQVEVPASAKIWFDGHPTVQAGGSRSFVSPPLTAGLTYQYTVRAEWWQGGRWVERHQTVSFHPGDRLSLDFTVPDFMATTSDSGKR